MGAVEFGEDSHPVSYQGEDKIAYTTGASVVVMFMIIDVAMCLIFADSTDHVSNSLLNLLLKHHAQVLLFIMKEAHHQVMEDDGIGSGPVDDNEDSMDKLDEEATNDSDPKGIVENSDEVCYY